MRLLKWIALGLLVSGSASGQTYTTMQWGMDKTATPYAFGANIGGTWRNLGTVNSAGVWTLSTNINMTATSANQNSAAYYAGTSGPGYFADYNNKAASAYRFDDTENQSAISGGGIRDAFFFQHRDFDTTNYTAIGQKVSNGIRSIMTGAWNGSDFQTQYKDLIAGEFTSVGKIGWNARGVSGVLGSAIQYGTGIASNEFWASNPAGGSQSVSMAAVQAVINPGVASADGSHASYSVLANNVATNNATAAFGVSGKYVSTVDLSNAVVTDAAIILPPTTNQGTIIDYGSDNYTLFDRTYNLAFEWVVNGVVPLFVAETKVWLTVPLQLKSSTIASLPTCNAGLLGSIVTVSNGLGWPTTWGTASASVPAGFPGTAVSATGAVTRSVICTNTGGSTTYAWAYN